MKKLKNIAGLTLAAALFLTGCGTSEAAETVETAGKVETEAAESQAETTFLRETETVSETEPDAAYDTAPQIPETVLYEGEDLILTAMGLRYLPDRAVLTYRAENPGELPMTLSPGVRTSPLTAVNGRYFPAEAEVLTLEAGETAEGTLSFPYETLLDLGIARIGEITFCLGNEDFTTGYLTVSTGVPFKPFFETLTEDADVMQWKIDFLEERIAYDHIGVRHMATAIIENAQGRKLLSMDFKNTTERTLILNTSEEVLNGLHLIRRGDMVTLLPHGSTQLLFDLTEIFAENHLETLGISQLGTLDFKASLYTETLQSAMEPRQVHLTLDPEVPAFSGGGILISEEEDHSVYYAGAAPDEMDGDRTVSLILAFENLSQGPLICQTAGLTCNGETVPCDMSTLRLTENGWGLLGVRVDPGYADRLDPEKDSFSLTVQKRISGTGENVTYALPRP